MASTKTITRLGDLLNVPFPTSVDNGKVLALVDYATGQHAYVPAGSQAALDTHTALTTSAHGGIVASTDSRLTDTRVPTDGSVTNAKVAAGAAIAYSKLALAGAIQVADLAFDPATQTELNTHTGATTAAHGGIVASTDPRLTDTRVPTDGSVTNAKVAGGAAIAYSKLTLTGAIVEGDLSFAIATQAELDAVSVASLILTPTSTGRNTITPTGAAVIPLTLVGLDSHSVPLLSLNAANTTSQARLVFPTTGAGHGVLGIDQWASVFNGTTDAVIAFGYNLNAGSAGGRTAGEASTGVYVESDFNEFGADATRTMEVYVQAFNNAGDKSVRPLFFDFKRNATTKETLLQSSVLAGGTGGITFAWRRDGGDATMAVFTPNNLTIYAPNTGASSGMTFLAAAGQAASIVLQYSAATAFRVIPGAATVVEFRVGSSEVVAFKIQDFFGSGRLIFPDNMSITVGTTNGTKIGIATNEKLGFYNAAPIAQRAGAAQAAVATTAATNVTPYGYTTAAQADAVVTLVNELRAWAVAQGFIKGAA
jgi:hypothetical protein